MKFSFASREEGFDEHISASIRGYSELIEDVVSYSRYFVENSTNVVDIGCSSGRLLRKMCSQNLFAKEAKYTGIEIEEFFYKHFDVDPLSEPNLSFFKGSVLDYKFENCSLITSIFTLQFIPMLARKTVLDRVYRGLNRGGAFLFSEKTIAVDPRIQEIKTFTYYDFKRKSFTTEDIMDKERELRHMLKPNTRNELLQMCADAGFGVQSIESFWQNHAFTAFVAIK